MLVIRSLSEMTAWAERQRSDGKKIALVPTMGFLHEGHLSLVQIAREQADGVVMSIYVNPTQFGPNEDFERYPRDFQRDQKLAADAGTDVIFAPADSDMYAVPHLTRVQVDRLTAVLCGSSRPTHFSGVTTVVAMLLNIVRPHIAVFGQKDAQQALVIRRMIEDLHYNIELIVGPIVRESDGLAKSSRNRYLTPDQRRSAVVLFQSLQRAESRLRQGDTDLTPIQTEIRETLSSLDGARIDYVEIVDAETLEPLTQIAAKRKLLIALAVYFGETRLIDNLLFPT